MKNIALKGKMWPARYSLRAAITIGERFGSVKRALFDENVDQGEQLRRRLAVLLEMLKAGKVWAEQENGESLPELPTEDELLDGITFREAADLTEAMLEVINEDDKGDFEAEGKGKNAEAR